MTEKRISVYVADVSPLAKDDSLFNKVYSSVSPERQQKTDRFRFKNDKCLSLCAEYLFMCACRDFGVEYTGQKVTAEDNSKPRFEDCNICFNLSHSGNKAMCIMSDYEVGCDIERKHKTNTDIADRYFSPDEKHLLSVCKSEKEKEELFFRLWTLKESFIKCVGLGLSLPLNSFSVYPGEEILIKQSAEDASFRLFDRALGEDYRCAVCIKEPENRSGFDGINKEEIVFIEKQMVW